MRHTMHVPGKYCSRVTPIPIAITKLIFAQNVVFISVFYGKWQLLGNISILPLHYETLWEFFNTFYQGMFSLEAMITIELMKLLFQSQFGLENF